MENKNIKDILLIRHAQSEFNVVAASSNFDLDNDKFGPALVNAKITQFGVNQCKDANEKLKDYEIDIVYSSPLLRCIETTLEVLKDHPSNPKIVIIPEIFENISSNCDICINQQVIDLFEYEKYKKCDFSIIKKYVYQKQEWQLQFMTKEKQNKVLNKMQRDNQTYIEACLEIMKQEWPERGLETYSDLYQRNILSKQALANYIKQNSNSDYQKKTVVVTHSQFLLTFISTKFNDLMEPQDGQWFQNAEIRPYQLQLQ